MITVNSEEVNICLHYIPYLQIVFFLCVKEVGEFKLFSVVRVPCKILRITSNFCCDTYYIYYTVIPRLTEIIRSGITFVSRSSLCYQASHFSLSRT
jgi:hypothetical protein